VSTLALVLGLAAATGLLSEVSAQQDSDAAGVAAAIRFQRAEDAAAARQARIEEEHQNLTSSARLTSRGQERP